MPAVLVEFAFCGGFWLIGTQSLRVSSEELFKQLAIDRIIAPVVERSGKSLWVHRRLARPIFTCQTFHEFAQQSTRRCSWADQFYRRQREKGKSHHSAIRSLAFKWIRILYACWRANKPYDESFYVNALSKMNPCSPST
jgi:hypothetical protein